MWVLCVCSGVALVGCCSVVVQRLPPDGRSLFAVDTFIAWFIHQAFSDYQLQQMTSNFIDQFGFNEEELIEQEEKIE